MAFDLIHRHDENATALTMVELQEQCPAAFSETAAPETSDRYGFVSTASAINILLDHGFEPVRAIQKPSRNNQSIMFNDHMISFNAPRLYDGSGERGELILYNSHNARSSLKLFAGAFRFVCSNGIVAGDGFQAKLRHSKLTANNFDTLVKEQAQTLPRLLDRIENLKAQTWEREQVLNFAYNAAALRWEIDPNENQIGREYMGELKGAYATHATLRDINAPRRYDDSGADAWRVFNRAQESLIRGGVRIRSYTDKAPYGKTRNAKGIAALSETVRVNRKLWDLADAVA